MNDKSGDKLLGDLMWAFYAAIIGGVLSGVFMWAYEATAAMWPALLIGSFTFLLMFLITVIKFKVQQGSSYKDRQFKRAEDDAERNKKELKTLMKQYEADSFGDQISALEQQQMKQRMNPAPINIINTVPTQQREELPQNVTPQYIPQPSDSRGQFNQ